eukprot:TRINITY_DN7858_c0_g1_i2.p1 TRINITY_DN7858_c0_g1~~TRINITY_DN7858_c0_g1_i2.p1  ORF type:complete len:256 (-),score=32.10 TRINITY_DN7858_c0_g1_i2:204-971(-)
MHNYSRRFQNQSSPRGYDSFYAPRQPEPTYLAAPSFGKAGAMRNLHNPPERGEIQVQALKQRAFHTALDQQMKHKEYEYHGQPRRTEIFDMRKESSGTSLNFGGGQQQARRYANPNHDPMHHGNLGSLFNPPTQEELLSKERARVAYVSGLNEQLQQHGEKHQILQLPRIHHHTRLSFDQPSVQIHPRNRRYTVPEPSQRPPLPQPYMPQYSPTNPLGDRVRPRVVPFESRPTRSDNLLENLSALHREEAITGAR